MSGAGSLGGDCEAGRRALEALSGGATVDLVCQWASLVRLPLLRLCRECWDTELGIPKVLPTRGPAAGAGKGGQKRAKERQQAPDSWEFGSPEMHDWAVERP